MTDLLERSVGPQIELRVELPATLPLASRRCEPGRAGPAEPRRQRARRHAGRRRAVDPGRPGRHGPQEASCRAAPMRASGSATPATAWMPKRCGQAIEPFFSTKELGKGTGLGLSMMHGLAIQLSGMLRLTSVVGRGTTAELWLPLTAMASEVKESKAVTLEGKEVAPRMTILMVDDDALIAMSTVDMLEDLGHQVIEANSGHEALELLQNGQAVDLLITDYSMPKMNGVQLAKAARQDPAGPPDSPRHRLCGASPRFRHRPAPDRQAVSAGTTRSGNCQDDEGEGRLRRDRRQAVRYYPSSCPSTR